MKKLFLPFLLAVVFLSACQPRNFNPDLTQEEIDVIRTEIVTLKEALEVSKQADKANKLVDSENPEDLEKALPYHLALIDFVRSYEKLGDYNKGISLYEGYLNDGNRAKAIYNNLGRLYEKEGKYALAVEQYVTIVRDYNDQNYLYDITWAYIRGKDRKMAEQYFNAWQLEHNKTDLQTQKAIKKLREEEK